MTVDQREAIADVKELQTQLNAEVQKMEASSVMQELRAHLDFQVQSMDAFYYYY